MKLKLVINFKVIIDYTFLDSNQKAEYTSLFKDVQKGWELCRHQLVNYSMTYLPDVWHFIIFCNRSFEGIET